MAEEDKKPLHRYALGLQVTEDEERIMRLQVKELKKKHAYTRSEILRIVCVKLLSDDEFISFLQAKTGLKKKEVRFRKR